MYKLVYQNRSRHCTEATETNRYRTELATIPNLLSIMVFSIWIEDCRKLGTITIWI